MTHILVTDVKCTLPLHLEEIVRMVKHGAAVGQVPVMFNSTFFEVVPGQLLAWANLKLHLSKVSLFHRALQQKIDIYQSEYDLLFVSTDAPALLLGDWWQH